MRATTKVFIVLALIFGLAATASAQVVIYALGSDTFRNDEEVEVATNQFAEQFGPSTLYTINPGNGQTTEIGPTGFISCNGLDAHPDTNELYAVCNRMVDIPPNAQTAAEELEVIVQVLVNIDKDTGEGTEIGPLGEGIGRRGTFVSDIDFRQDGTLFGYLICDFCGDDGRAFEKTNNLELISGNALGTIDMNTGEFLPIGESGLKDDYSAIGFTRNQALNQCANVFDDETIFNSLYSMNQATGSSMFLSPIAFPIDFAEFDLLITSKDADTASGIMYGLMLANERRGGGVIITPRETRNIAASGTFLTMMDPNSNVLDVVGQSSGPEEALLAIAVMSQPKNVPTMSEYGLIATVVLLLGASVLYLRRRQANSQI